MSNHTPGPWLADEEDAIYANNELVARCYFNLQRAANAADNARLIAAAPDLASALQHIARACEPGLDQSDDELELFIYNVKKIARAALAKAGL